MESATTTPTKITPTDVAVLFNQAENVLKKIERIHSDIIIPSINQLRYAGCHLTRHIQNPDNDDELLQASNHCKRAIYDGYEAGIIFFLKSVMEFEEDYRRVVISSVIPDWANLKSRISNVKQFLASISSETRQEHYQECEKYFDEIGTILSTLEGAREDLNKKINKDRVQTFIVWMTLFTLLFVALTFFGFNRTNSSPIKQTAPADSPKISTSESLPKK
jgi:hypothetical protein